MTMFGLDIQAFTSLANLVLSAVLLVFTGGQVWVAWYSAKGERLAREEAARIRAEDAEKLLDAAFQQVWAEHFRLDSLADQWEKADLVELSLFGLLQPEDVRLRDPALMMESLARLGVEAAHLGAVALTFSADIAHQVAMFNAGIADTARLHFPDKDTATKIEGVKHYGGAELQERSDNLRRSVRQLSLLIWDAVSHTPRAQVIRNMNFNDDVKSDYARAAVGALLERSKESNSIKDEEEQKKLPEA